MGLAVRQVLNIVYLQCAVAAAECVLTIITELSRSIGLLL